MENKRIETDFLGSLELPENALYGIHSLRAKENFPDKTRFNLEWYKALGVTKQACYITYKNFKKNVTERISPENIKIRFFSDEIIDLLIDSATEIAEGKHFDSFIVPAIQGGAGTSINLNVNEILTNVSLIKSGNKAGDYSKIDAIEHANIYQSTNDVIPTSLKIVTLKLLVQLEEKINELRFKLEELERTNRNRLRIAYTQMQEAVPSSYGMLFSTYNEALSRDWWRVSKCFERIKTVNLGGSAIGTGITVPRFFVMEASQTLQRLTNLPIARNENLPDATCNLDSFVEIHAILKAHAVNLEKIVSDIRLLASDLVSRKEIEIPKMQVGSSIMPGKINPVIPEFVVSISHKVYANDMLIGSLASQGVLDLNAYIPTIGNALLESLELLISANSSLLKNMMNGLVVHTNLAEEKLYKSVAISTALVPHIGYHRASEVAKLMKIENLTVFEANARLCFISPEKIEEILEPQNLLKCGFSIHDL